MIDLYVLSCVVCIPFVLLIFVVFSNKQEQGR